MLRHHPCQHRDGPSSTKYDSWQGWYVLLDGGPTPRPPASSLPAANGPAPAKETTAHATELSARRLEYGVRRPDGAGLVIIHHSSGPMRAGGEERECALPAHRVDSDRQGDATAVEGGGVEPTSSGARRGGDSASTGFVLSASLAPVGCGGLLAAVVRHGHWQHHRSDAGCASHGTSGLSSLVGTNACAWPASATSVEMHMERPLAPAPAPVGSDRGWRRGRKPCSRRRSAANGTLDARARHEKALDETLIEGRCSGCRWTRGGG